MYVCHCEAITDRTIDAAIASGVRTVDEVTARCRAGGGCGGCHKALQALIDAADAQRQPAASSAA
jgi:bacterioferritin-associated ferredoxin